MAPRKRASKPWDGYVRVSKVAGRAGERFISPQQQQDAIRGWAKLHGIELSEVWTDLDVSGGKMRRPGFDKMLARLARGEIAGVCVAKVDRFARSLVGALDALAFIEKHGGQFASVADSFDTSTPGGRMQLNILLVFAQFERERIGDSWQDAAERAVERGAYILKGQHFGYTKDDAGHLHVAEDEQSIVRQLFRRRAQRQSWSALADWMNAEWPRGGGLRWTHQNVRQIIQSRMYLGESSRGDIVNPNAHEAIVTLAEFDAANYINGGEGPIKRNDPPLLAGLIRCQGCGYAMTRSWSSDKHPDGTVTKIAGYRCPTKHTAGICPAPAYAKADDLDMWVLLLFLYWHGEAYRQPNRPDLEAVAEAEATLEDHERRLADVMADDALREAAPDAHLRDVKRRQQLVEEAQAKLAKARAEVALTDQRPILLAEDWDAADSKTRHALLIRAIDAVYVRRGNNPRGNGPLQERVWIRWAGEDDFDRPKRGRKLTAIQSVPWPEPLEDAAAVVAQWEREGIADVILATLTERYGSITRDQFVGIASMLVESSPEATALQVANVPAWARTRMLDPFVPVPGELARGLDVLVKE